jgi:hypothetical protein
MRRRLVPPLVPVEVPHDVSVHHQPFVGVDTDAEETRVGVDLEDLVTGSQTVENAGFVQDGQVGHVFLLFELGRVCIKNLVLGERHRLTRKDESFHRRTAWGVQRARRRPQATRLQGVEGSGKAGPGETLGSPCSPLAIRPWF